MAVAFIVGAVALKKLVEKQGEKLVSANDKMDTMNEDQAYRTDRLNTIQKDRTDRLNAIQKGRDDRKAELQKSRDDRRGVVEDPTQEEPLTKANQQDLDDEDMTEVTDIDTGKPALKAERDPMIESELDRLLTLARG